MELFSGIGLGVLRTALAAGHKIRRYSYCDRDPVSRLIVEEVIQKLQQEFPGQLRQRFDGLVTECILQGIVLIGNQKSTVLLTHPSDRYSLPSIASLCKFPDLSPHDRAS